MSNSREFLEQEIKAGRLLHTKGNTLGMKDSNCKQCETTYINARALLKKAKEPESYAIARALLEGY